MLEVFAHVTAQEIPSFWLAMAVGFVAGVGVTFAALARKLR